MYLALHFLWDICPRYIEREGPFISSVTRDAAFFRLGFTPPPSSRSLFLEFRRVTLLFTAVRLLSVYFRLASRSIFSVRDCVIRDAIYEWSLITHKTSAKQLTALMFYGRKTNR